MAKLYILSDDHIKNGTRPKTPREKLRIWKIVSIVLTIVIIAENIFLLVHGIK